MRFIIGLILVFCFTNLVAAKEAIKIKQIIESGSYQNDDYKSFFIDDVLSGDSFEVSGLTLKIWGIKSPSERGNAEQSKLVLQALTLERLVKCKSITVVQTDNKIAHCYVGDADLGGLMIKAGFAVEDVSESHGFYNAEQTFAKKAKLGIWEE